MENNFEIIDANGTIHSGTSDEMDSAWDVMICNDLDEYLKMMGEMDVELIDPDNIVAIEKTFEKYHCDFSGDLKLIEVYKIHK
jgi:hypothetical protein